VEWNGFPFAIFFSLEPAHASEGCGDSSSYTHHGLSPPDTWIETKA